MDVTALTFWLLTVMGGLYMLGITMRTGNRQSSARVSHLPSAVVFSHGALALLGLAVWALYMRSEGSGYAWLAFTILLVVAALGLFMMSRWKKDRKGTEEQVAERRETVAEQQIPGFVVAVHGLGAAATILFVVLAALTVGNSP